MQRRYFWTIKEARIVAEHYPRGGIKACLELLPYRSKSSIYQQARKQGLMFGDNKPRPRKIYEATPEIDYRIKECYRSNTEKGTVKKLAKRIGRPYWWVKKRAQHIGCASPVVLGNKAADWSKKEMELLEKNAHKNPDVIARIFRQNGFNRTATAVVVKRKRMHLSAISDDHYSATRLAVEFGVDAKVVVRWIEQGWLRAKRRGTDRKQSQGGDMWWIKRKDVKAFVAESVGIIDLRKVDKVWFVDLLVNT